MKDYGEGDSEAAADLLTHYTRWLQANNARDDDTYVPGNLLVSAEEHEQTLSPVEVVARYMELQWGEDREATWGHAFE